MGLPTARFEPVGLVPVRVTVLLATEELPAASCAFTKYDTVAVSGWLSVYVSTFPATVVIWVPLRNTSYPVTPTLSVDAPQVSLICPDAGWVKASPLGAVGAWVSPLWPVRVTL